METNDCCGMRVQSGNKYFIFTIFFSAGRAGSKVGHIDSSFECSQIVGQKADILLLFKSLKFAS